MWFLRCTSIAATVTAVIAALAASIRVLPEVIDLSIIPTSGVFSFAFTGYGAGAVGAPTVYALLLVSAAVTGVGFVRWEEREHPHR